MADDVTLLPCPMCGGTDIRIAHLSASPDQSVWCHSCQLRTKWCYRDDAIAAWNTRVSDPRIAALEAQLADARDCIDLFNRIIVRAECKWKEQHPDSEFYPDVPDLIVWLKEQVDTLGEAADA